MVISTRMSLIVPCLISAPISNLTASGNSNLTVFGPSVAAAHFYTSPIYIALDF